jgi:starch synthase
VPSRFEPCGLTQVCALRYGALPVVARVGGLADTVTDAASSADDGTGIQFFPVTRDALEAAIVRTAALWRDPPAWRRLRSNGMRAPVGWAAPARLYADLYRLLVG